jgi:hypothetical protein
MTGYLNRVYHMTSTLGQSTSIQLSATAASDAFLTMSEAGAIDAALYSYVLEEGGDFEVQRNQTYNSSAGTLTRGTPTVSKIDGVVGTTKMTLTGNAAVRVTPVAADYKDIDDRIVTNTTDLTTAKAQLNGFINLLSYGADRTGVADSTTAFTNAIAALNALGGGTVFVPAGTYKITNTITISTDHINIVGAGIEATKIVPVFASARNAFTVGTADYVRFSDLTIRGDTDGLGRVSTGIQLGNCYRPTLERINIEYCVKNIYLATGTDNHYHAYLVNVRTNFGGTGLQIGESGTTTQPWQNVIMQNCSFGAATVQGVLIYAVGGLQWNEGEIIFGAESMRVVPGNGQDVKGMMFTNVFFDTPTVSSITFNVGSAAATGKIVDVMFTGCSINNSQGTHGMSIEGATSGTRRVEGIKFIGCSFVINARQGLYMQGVRNVDIDFCHFVSNSVSASNSYDGLAIGDYCDQVRVNGGFSGKRVDFAASQRYGVSLTATSTNVTVKDINLFDNLTAGLKDFGSVGLIVKDVKGFKTKHRGTSFIPGSATSVAVTHSLDAAPTNENINIQEVQDFEGRRLWISAVSATTFTVSMSSTLPTDRYFTWSAEVYEK